MISKFFKWKYKSARYKYTVLLFPATLFFLTYFSVGWTMQWVFNRQKQHEKELVEQNVFYTPEQQRLRRLLLKKIQNERDSIQQQLKNINQIKPE
jgi:hypothetical protein